MRRGALVVTLKKKTGAKIGHALSRGDQKRASKIVANTGEIHNVVKLGRALEAAGHEDVEGRVVTALADCLTAMDTDKSPFEVEKETSQVKQNQANYLAVTALKGRRGRAPTGKDIRVDAKTTVEARVADKERYRATRDGKRKQRRVGQTETTHKLMFKKEQNYNMATDTKRRGRMAHAMKAHSVATPRYCHKAGVRGDGMPLFVTQAYDVPEGSDNSPLIAEEAAARAVEHRAEKGKKTRAEIAADRRARLPDNVRPSVAKSRAGQYYVAFPVNKSCPSYAIRKLAGTTGAVSVVKPGTDGFYPSTKAAAEVRDEWIELKRPESWLTKRKN